MPVYNGEKYVGEAIDSILAQTFSDFELIIVDDGSQDRSAEVIREYEKRDERIRFLRHERNRGEAAARNRGLDAATGDYIAAMDCDDLSLPQRLEEQVRYLQSQSRNRRARHAGHRNRQRAEAPARLSCARAAREHRLQCFLGQACFGRQRHDAASNPLGLRRFTTSR